ncbi:MAG: YdcF family protein [Elainellaceae cyanobacterium]
MTLKHYWRLGAIGLLTLLLLWLGLIPVRLALAAQQAPQPQAILVLGGASGREEAAAQLARYNPNLEIWVSSGKTPRDAYPIFQEAGITPDRLHLDYRATDTVTNFTTLVNQFKQRDIQHLYLVTSDFHMPRAMTIAAIVLGHSGIAFTPVPVPSDQCDESWLRIARDGGRSILWIVTGRTGGRIGLMLQEKLSQLVANQK